MLTAVQVRLSYLQILGDLKMYNGKIFNATLMVRVHLFMQLGFGILSCCLALCISYCTWTITAKIRMQEGVLTFLFHHCVRSYLNQSKPYLRQKCFNIFS